MSLKREIYTNDSRLSTRKSRLRPTSRNGVNCTDSQQQMSVSFVGPDDFDDSSESDCEYEMQLTVGKAKSSTYEGNPSSSHSGHCANELEFGASVVGMPVAVIKSSQTTLLGIVSAFLPQSKNYKITFDDGHIEVYPESNLKMSRGKAIRQIDDSGRIDPNSGDPIIIMELIQPVLPSRIVGGTTMPSLPRLQSAPVSRPALRMETIPTIRNMITSPTRNVTRTTAAPPPTEHQYGGYPPSIDSASTKTTTDALSVASRVLSGVATVKSESTSTAAAAPLSIQTIDGRYHQHGVLRVPAPSSVEYPSPSEQAPLPGENFTCLVCDKNVCDERPSYIVVRVPACRCCAAEKGLQVDVEKCFSASKTNS